MGVFSWFKKKPNENYEEILDELAISISNRQTRLTELALRERRAALWSTIYVLAGWAIYSFVWYLRLLPHLFSERTRSNVEIERVAHLAPVIIGPIAAISLRRIVQFWYRRKGAAEEATLKELLAKQRTTIEEIKQKTNYYSTRNLIERYDNKGAAGPQTPQNPRVGPAPGSQIRQRPRPSGRPEEPQLGAPADPRKPPPQTPSIVPPQTSSQFAASPPAPPQRQWFDKVADALLGVDEANSPSLDPARTRYALICARCSAHNGLVLESLWEDTQYICPKCGFFNPAPRSLKNQGTPSPDARASLQRLSAEPDEREGRLAQPNFLGIRHSPEPSRSRSRTSSRLSHDATTSMDVTVDEPGPEADPEQRSVAGDVSVMDVDH